MFIEVQLLKESHLSQERKKEILILFCGTLHHKLFPNSLQFWLAQVAAYLSWRETH